MKKAIMFDLDGTLINSLPDIAAAMNRSLLKNGLMPFDENAYRYMVGDGVINLSLRVTKQCPEKQQSVLQDYMADYAQSCAVETHPYEGIPEMLHTLSDAGFLIFVFSNKDQQDVEKVCAHYFPGFAFTAVGGRRENVPVKPAPDGALKMLETYGLSPEECWYVGDTNTDMRCGTNAGMDTIGVLWGFREKEELIETGAKYLADKPADILTILENH